MGRVYFLSLWTNVHSERTRRRFRRFSSPNVIAWFWSIWRARQGGVTGPHELKLKREESVDIEDMFDRALDDDDCAVKHPASDEDILYLVRRYLDADAEPHFVHFQTDDDEVYELECFIFDDIFLATPDALDRLPHPDRGRPTKALTEDRYEQLIERLLTRRDNANRREQI